MNKISETGRVTPTKIGLHAFHINLYLHELFEPILFFDPHGIVHGQKGNFGCFEGNINVAISPKPERSHPPKSVCMHFTSTSTCLNFLSQFYFLTPMDYIVHGRKGNFGCFEGKRKMSNISETGEVTPTKIGLHAFHINLYLHEFFVLILFFDPHGLYIVHGRKGNFGCFEGNINVAISLKPERSHPPKLVCMHFTSTPTCMNFLSQFYFLTPMDYSPWSEGKFWQMKNEQNL